MAKYIGTELNIKGLAFYCLIYLLALQKKKKKKTDFWLYLHLDNH